MRVPRREFLRTGTLISCAASVSIVAPSQTVAIEEISGPRGPQPGPIFVATWPFGLPACQRAKEVLAGSGNMLDAVERGINLTESNPEIDSVGLGGLPNADGIVQLDACIMDGVHQRAGAVAALENFANPISVARRVMEVTKHVTLVGADAARFAKLQGFTEQNLLTDKSRQRWEAWKNKPAASDVGKPTKSHDTISLLGLGIDGHLCGGCSTSGLAFKLPGRVGDSPIIGSGLYVDGQVGAAGATGIGENVLRYCGSFLIVEFMRQGISPTDACVKAIERISKGDGKAPKDLSVNFIAIDKRGNIGAAGTDDGFRVAFASASEAAIFQPTIVR